MGKFQPQRISTTVGQVRRGADLCRENARRLVRNAKILLEHGGSDGAAYVLLSLAVKEIGKGVLLRDQVSGAESNEVVIELSKDHDEKFLKGLDDIPGLQNLKFGRCLHVTSNPRSTTTILDDSLRPGAFISVGPGLTGMWTNGPDEKARLDATVRLRLDLLYVDWDERNGRFHMPEAAIWREGLNGRWELDRDDMFVALNALEEGLKGARA